MNHVYDDRYVFENAVEIFNSAGVNASEAKLTQDYLRFEVIAQTGSTQYQYGVLNNQSATPQPAGSSGATRPNEVRLNLQDAFIVSSVQMLLGKAATIDDAAFPVYSWNNPITFPASSGALNNFYNGKMSLTVNNVITTVNWDLLRHKVINQTQLTAATNSPLDQFDGGNDGRFPVEPNWILIGSKNNQLQINLNQAIGTLETGTVQIVLVCILRGVLAQNVTVVS